MIVIVAFVGMIILTLLFVTGFCLDEYIGTKTTADMANKIVFRAVKDLLADERRQRMFKDE